MTTGSLSRRILKAFPWVLGGVALVVVAVVAVNATDEALSVEAEALLARPAMGQLDQKNGFIAFLGMGAPRGEDQIAWGLKAAAAYSAQAKPGFARTPEWEHATKSHLRVSKAAAQWCPAEARDCIAFAKEKRDALAKHLAEESNAEFLRRYRKVREAATFVDLYVGTSLFAAFPAYPRLVEGAALSRLDIAIKASGGDLEGALDELESDMAFHRRVIAGGQTVVGLMAANAMLSSDLLALSELVRTEGDRLAPYRARVRELSKTQVEAGALATALQLEGHMSASFLHGIRGALGDTAASQRLESFTDLTLRATTSPFENWARSLLVRPNQTVNEFAYLHSFNVKAALTPAGTFDAADGLRADKPQESSIARTLRNPEGRLWLQLTASDLRRYAARSHDLAALGRMVDLQAALSERGIADSAAIAAFVAGEGATSHADPYTGQAFAFDPQTRQLSFKPRGHAAWSRELQKHYKSAALVL